MTDHLEPKITDRGFRHLPPIPSSYGGDIRAYESSSAMHPHLWVSIECPVNLNKPDGEMKEAVVHLRIEDAEKFKEQLEHLIASHYQLEPSPAYQCLDCPARFGSEEAMNAHINTKHNVGYGIDDEEIGYHGER